VRMSTSEADSLRAIDDASEWGTPKPGRKSEKRQRSAVVSVRMTQGELARVQAEAQALNQTVGTYMRDVALGRQVKASETFRPLVLLTNSNASFLPHLQQDSVNRDIRAWHERYEPVLEASRGC